MADNEKEELGGLEKETPSLRVSTERQSYNGLYAFGGQIEEECNFDLKWPECMTTYKAMLKDATIVSALNFMEMQISKVKWKVKIPEGHEEKLKTKAKFVESVMIDMEHSWTDFIRRAATFNKFGFSAVEKVYRKRKRSNGSRYDDGLYGIRELPLIAQDSITAWEWEKSGRKLSGLWQEKNIPTGKEKYKVFKHREDDKFIRREKFMLFRADPLKDSPIGTSPLNNVYMAWRYKSEMERQQALGVATDVRGMKVIYIPPQYMSESATPEEKETYEGFKRVLARMHAGEQSGIILPMAYDEGKPMFEFEIKSVLGQSTYDISKIISHYRAEIVTGLMAPMMILGQDGSGSFALAEALEGITSTVVEARLIELRDTLNQDFIKQLFEVNGWDTEVLPQLEFEEVKRTNLDEWSSAVQRIASNGLIRLNAATVNTIHSKLGFDTAYDDEKVTVEEIRENATNFDSSAGEGLASPTGQGTAKKPSTGDSSVANREN